MKIQKTTLVLAALCLMIFSCSKIFADVEINQKVADILESSGLNEWLSSPINVSKEESGIISIVDKSNFLKQYLVSDQNAIAEPNIIIDPNVQIPSTCDKIVIITHGWVEKAEDEISAKIADAINSKTDPNEWVCGYFDWRGGSRSASPVSSSMYARDVAGPRLAGAVLKLGKFKHIHLISFSAGSWVIDSAAKMIAKETDAQIHLTFLDAYVPIEWDESELGNFGKSKSCWVEHYYAKDITLDCTEVNLTNAYNVNITKIDPGISGHKFPLFWYLATINGKYRADGLRRWGKLFNEHKGLKYGFARSLESGQENWTESLTLQRGSKAVELKKPGKKWFGLKK
ncbi:MAG: hypothetical protein JW806_02780 [Sedimentisphaerales bacterium]|nr:hypothetical protein [Sedimentisphaerales bacterium]